MPVGHRASVVSSSRGARGFPREGDVPWSVPESLAGAILFSSRPTIVVGLIFWFIVRAMLRSDRTERAVYAKVEAEERARGRGRGARRVARPGRPRRRRRPGRPLRSQRFLAPSVPPPGASPSCCPRSADHASGLAVSVRRIATDHSEFPVSNLGVCTPGR